MKNVLYCRLCTLYTVLDCTLCIWHRPNTQGNGLFQSAGAWDSGTGSSPCGHLTAWLVTLWGQMSYWDSLSYDLEIY